MEKVFKNTLIVRKKFPYKKEIDLASSGYYEEIHDRLKLRADVNNKIFEDDKVTVKELGGWECAKCHY